MHIGLLYAMPSELEGLLRRFPTARPHRTAGLPCWRLTDHVTACLGGVGKVNAAMAAALLCREYPVELLINAGVAGCFTDLATGTVVVASSCVQHDVDTSLAGDPVGLVSTVQLREFPVYSPADTCARLRAGGLSPVTGVVATGDWFGRDYDRARWIAREFGALVCDMEGCAAAQVGLRLGIPVCVIKAVSDHLFSSAQDKEYAAGQSPAARTLTDAVLCLIQSFEKEHAIWNK